MLKLKLQGCFFLVAKIFVTIGPGEAELCSTHPASAKSLECVHVCVFSLLTVLLTHGTWNSEERYFTSYCLPPF